MDTTYDSPDGAYLTTVPRPRRPHTARWAGIATLVICAALIAVLATIPSAQTVEARTVLVAHHSMAPKISGLTVNSGWYRLPKVPNRYVVVNFFASWCIPCEEEGPDLVAFEFDHSQSRDASVVSVVFSDSSSQARAFQEKLGANWPTLADSNGSIALAYGVHEDPTTYVIAPNGRVVASVVGGVTEKGLDAIILKAKALGYGN